MNLQKIENEAMHLPKGERASLIQKLVLSFDTPTPLELREDWLIEAQNRAKELDQGSVTPIPGNEVLQKARALIK
ncbi:MAG: addiction module protein [Gammaproteobacteria bacterium]|jgi:putative addiction module component (TIGR02574 family)|nr:addiction module protein [Gammaproteobacteria bacterium]